MTDGPIYPKHSYSYETLEMALVAANERAHRWEEACLSQKELDRQYKEILNRLDKLDGGSHD